VDWEETRVCNPKRFPAFSMACPKKFNGLALILILLPNNVENFDINPENGLLPKRVGLAMFN
jgi:hypothetical protein